MPDYVLELEADTDMLEIGRYTARRWGLDQMDVYLSGLESHFSAIAKRTAREESVFEHREDFRVAIRYRVHLRHSAIYLQRTDWRNQTRYRTVRILSRATLTRSARGIPSS